MSGAMNAQSILDSAGPQAARTEALWWFAFWVSAAVYVLTIGALFWALARSRARARRGEALAEGEAERHMTRAVAGGVAATVAILLVFFFYDLSVGRPLTQPPAGKDPLLIEVVGHQWWWEVRYPDPLAQNHFSTANELHVPVGRPVVMTLSSRDVIHSIWIPNLGGKRDLTPGYTQTIWFQADTPGVYRGQCAEFCGHQHAKMALHVIAEPPAQFARWVAQSRKPAPEPADSLAARGREVFLAGPCAMCHAINGTPAGSRSGPDLTHVASRPSIAAGTLANTPGNLAAWIVDPQGIKPGTHMPPTALAPRDLGALLAYLQVLR